MPPRATALAQALVQDAPDELTALATRVAECVTSGRKDALKCALDDYEAVAAPPKVVSEPEPAPWPEPEVTTVRVTELSAKRARAYVAEVEDLAELLALEAEEEANKGRTSVLRAISKQQEAILQQESES
jgi:hypothetical protein